MNPSDHSGEKPEREGAVERNLYAQTPREWVRRWDAGETIWTIEMGGMGPGYEQGIQVVAVELVRHMVAADYAHQSWDDKECWRADRDKIEAWAHKNKAIKKISPSGAMFYAALNLATNVFSKGPEKAFAHPTVRDRRIQARRDFP